MCSPATHVAVSGAAFEGGRHGSAVIVEVLGPPVPSCTGAQAGAGS